MEKLVYTLWKKPDQSTESFKESLLGEVAEGLGRCGVEGLQFNFVDEAVEPAAPSRILSSKTPPDGMAFFWMHTAIDRGDAQRLLDQACDKIAGYLVTESMPLRSAQSAPTQGARSDGYNQVVFLCRPKSMSEDAWFDYWFNSHAPIAIDIQSSFRYVHNVVARHLTADAPAWDAIVEESFPVEAMTDRMAFYAADGDEAKYREREQQMIDSCSKFIDFERMDCIPTSEYLCGQRTG